MPTRSGRGLFADALATRFPLLPLEEEGRLNDPRLRENFVERIFASIARLTALFVPALDHGRHSVRFHTAHKLTLMAHKPQAESAARSAGGVWEISGTPLSSRAGFSSEFMAALATMATPRRHTTFCNTCSATSRTASIAKAGLNCWPSFRTTPPGACPSSCR